MLVVLTTRPELTAPWDAGEVRSHVLGGLRADDARALLRGLLGDTPVADEVITAIVQQTDGVPLFVEELTRTLLDTGALVERDGRYVLDSVFDASLLFAATVRDEAAVQADLDALAAADLVVHQRRVAGSRYIFRHALIRDVAYDSMLRGPRERIHARIAEVLVGEFPDLAEIQPAELARHHAGARAFAPAVGYVTRAAQRSLERSVNAEALAHASNGMAWAAELTGADRVEAELRLNGIATQAVMAARGWADSEVKTAIDRSQGLLERLETSEHRVPTLWSLFIYHFVAVNRDRAREIAEELIAIAERADDRGLAVASGTLLGMSRYQDDEAARASLERTVELARRLGWPRAEYRAIVTLARGLGETAHQGRLDQLALQYPHLREDRPASEAGVFVSLDDGAAP